MHEAAIAREIYDIAARAMEENGLTRLEKVVMDIGEYTAVVPEQLRIVWVIAVHNTPMEGCALEMNMLPAQPGMYVRTIEGI
jgi:hydrogenase nickel incorporation protein HypA/HybF